MRWPCLVMNPILKWLFSTRQRISNIGRMVLQRHCPLSAILLTPLSIFAQLPTLRSNIFFNEDTAGVLDNT